MIYRNSSDRVHIPPISIAEHVLSRATKYKSKNALIDAFTGETITYGKLDELTARGASGLVRAGIAPGDVVALAGPNSPMYAVAVHSILRAGAAVTPLNPAMTSGEMAKQIADSGARALISSQDAARKLEDAPLPSPLLHRFTLEPADESEAECSTKPFNSLLDSSPGPLPSIDPNDVAVLPYSSGTTGTAKGVVLTHRNIVANLEQLRAGWRISEDDVVCAALPFFHIYGFTIILNSALLAGATIVTLPRFELRAYLSAVQDFGVTRGHLAPPVVLALANSPDVDEFDLTSMRTAVSGAAPLDRDTAARAEIRTGIIIRQGYGMTEASPGTHLVYDGEFDATPSGSVGRLLPDTEARIVDPGTNEDVPPGERGELLVRGPQVMREYLNNPAATTATITDGWLHTGDIAQVVDGNFYIVDRLKELIKYKGYQVAPAELEALLLTHPQVHDAAVVGLPDVEAGEIPQAFVVADTILDVAELMAWIARQVAPYKRIRDIQLVDKIPRSAAGKILRRVLKVDLRSEETTPVQEK
ncbi:AMP-binding protein [Rhodococcus globerulus]|uniref:AMP-binding protein n=1 Tax=Rhodococcus globerulus TaxID=33008 RepID=UPI000A46E7C0|nr:AMP-binding protein [Rhodococcus globerulus]